MSDDAQRNAPNRSTPRHWRDAQTNFKIQIAFMDSPLQDNASNKKLFTALTTAQKICDDGTGRVRNAKAVVTLTKNEQDHLAGKTHVEVWKWYKQALLDAERNPRPHVPDAVARRVLGRRHPATLRVLTVTHTIDGKCLVDGNDNQSQHNWNSIFHPHHHTRMIICYHQITSPTTARVPFRTSGTFNQRTPTPQHTKATPTPRQSSPPRLATVVEETCAVVDADDLDLEGAKPLPSDPKPTSTTAPLAQMHTTWQASTLTAKGLSKNHAPTTAVASQHTHASISTKSSSTNATLQATPVQRSNEHAKTPVKTPVKTPAKPHAPKTPITQIITDNRKTRWSAPSTNTLPAFTRAQSYPGPAPPNATQGHVNPHFYHTTIPIAPALVKSASIKSIRMNLAPHKFNVHQLKQSLEASLSSEQDTYRDLDTAKYKPQVVAYQPDMEKDQLIKAYETMQGMVNHRTGTRATTTRAPPMNSAHTRLYAVIITGTPGTTKRVSVKEFERNDKVGSFVAPTPDAANNTFLMIVHHPPRQIRSAVKNPYSNTRGTSERSAASRTRMTTPKETKRGTAPAAAKQSSVPHFIEAASTGVFRTTRPKNMPTQLALSQNAAMATLRTNPSVHQLALKTTNANNHVVQIHVEFTTTNEPPQGYQVWIHGVAIASSSNPDKSRLINLTVEAKMKLPHTSNQTQRAAMYRRRLATRLLAEVMVCADTDKALQSSHNQQEAYVVITNVAMGQTMGTARQPKVRSGDSPGKAMLNTDMATVQRVLAKHTNLQYKEIAMTKTNHCSPAHTWLKQHWQRATPTPWKPLSNAGKPHAPYRRRVPAHTDDDTPWTTVPMKTPAGVTQAPTTHKHTPVTAIVDGASPYSRDSHTKALTLNDLKQHLPVDPPTPTTNQPAPTADAQRTTPSPPRKHQHEPTQSMTPSAAPVPQAVPTPAQPPLDHDLAAHTQVTV